MKITGLETYHVRPRWLFLKITTDEGICGWGEPVVEGKSRTVAMAVREFGEAILGRNPLHIEAIWQQLYRGSFYRGGPVLTSALSGIEQALWDIKGKALGVPVYDLLGGPVRQQIRMYTHIKKVGAQADFPVETMVETARQLCARGFTALKYSIIPPVRAVESLQALHEHEARFQAVREAIGPAVDLAIDFHGRVGPGTAQRLITMLEPFYPWFVEEAVLPENAAVMAQIARGTPVPLASGERLFTRWGFRELLDSQAVKIIQPDLCHVGGIFEARKLAAMAEIYYMSVAPHNPLGPVSLAACLQLDACIPNFLAQEYPGMADGLDLGQGILRRPFTVIDGSIAIPEGPGLGIEVDEQALAALAYDGIWESPTLTYDDGSLADW
ncbi:MAG: galactonate dehydratase [Eubacteriales bacterium]|nr:galactonate dehydratase [Clostridiales bacterium]MDD4141121.1 galactonate dehydratase [Eubacteriales bacterium]